MQKVNEFDNKKIYIRRLVLAVGVLVVALFQNTDGLLPSAFGILPMPLLPLVICIAMFERELPGTFFAVFAGLLWDTASPSGSNRHAILLAIFAFAAGALITHIMRNNFLTALLLSGGAVVLHALFFFFKDFIFSGRFDGAYKLLTFYIPSCIYTMLFVPLFYFLIRALEKKFPDR